MFKGGLPQDIYLYKGV